MLFAVGLAGVLLVALGVLFTAVGFSKEVKWDGAAVITLFVLGGFPLVTGVWFVRDARRRWSEELTVFATGLIRRHNGRVEVVHWSGVTHMDVEIGAWMVEWVLLQFDTPVPRLTIRTAESGTWVFRANMGDIEQLCQLVPALWTAYQAGLR